MARTSVLGLLGRDFEYMGLPRASVRMCLFVSYGDNLKVRGKPSARQSLRSKEPQSWGLPGRNGVVSGEL